MNLLFLLHVVAAGRFIISTTNYSTMVKLVSAYGIPYMLAEEDSEIQKVIVNFDDAAKSRHFCKKFIIQVTKVIMHDLYFKGISRLL